MLNRYLTENAKTFKKCEQNVKKRQRNVKEMSKMSKGHSKDRENWNHSKSDMKY